ncbi:MAG: formimidoylglutamate deiminase [Paracoccaceae bacterium]|nr:formimidoylglutamate deiminase [Paracoccaceae bacterium]
MRPEPTVIHARKALTGDGWFDDICVQIDAAGRIAAVSAGSGRPKSSADSIVGILLPAPANLHSHGFQRAMAGLTERRGPDTTESFWTWRQLMYRFLDRLGPEDFEAINAFAQMQMAEAGYAAVAEFHYVHHQVGGRPYDNLAELSERIFAAATDSGIGLTLLPVFYQFGGFGRRPLKGGQRRFGNDPDRFASLFGRLESTLPGLTPDCRIGTAVHSLRAADPADLSAIASLDSGGGPIHMHLAEQADEVTGSLAALGARPGEWLCDNADLSSRWCLIHCTQICPGEIDRLARTGAITGLCPVTESSLGDGIFPAGRFLGAEGQFGVGTDSNIRISLAEELRTLEYSQRLRDQSRAVLAEAERSCGRLLFDAACTGGRVATGRQGGVITAGLYADLLALDDTHPDLDNRVGDTILDSFVFCGADGMITDLWSAGRHIVQQGQHVRRNRITASYVARLRTLTDSL